MAVLFTQNSMSENRAPTSLINVSSVIMAQKHVVGIILKLLLDPLGRGCARQLSTNRFDDKEGSLKFKTSYAQL